MAWWPWLRVSRGKPGVRQQPTVSLIGQYARDVTAHLLAAVYGQRRSHPSMTTEGENPRDRADQSRDGRSSWHEDTYAMRLGRLKRRNRQLIAVGAGLTAFVVAVAASAAADSIYDEVPGWLRASIFTLVVAAAGGLGRLDSLPGGDRGHRGHDRWPPGPGNGTHWRRPPSHGRRLLDRRADLHRSRSADVPSRRLVGRLLTPAKGAAERVWLPPPGTYLWTGRTDVRRLRLWNGRRAVNIRFCR